MKTKKVYVSTNQYSVFNDLLKKLQELGIKIIEKSYDVVFERYDILTEMTRDQAVACLAFEDCILWKGEP